MIRRQKISRRNTSRLSRRRTLESLETRILLAADFGDAPEGIEVDGVMRNYPTTGSGGANHQVVQGGPFLGAGLPDMEADGQPTAGADGDDNNGQDDEDGVAFSGATSGPGMVTPGEDFTASVTITGSGFVNVFADFNVDGDWDDAGEQLLDNFAFNTFGTTVNQPFGDTVPLDATPGTTFFRIRVSSQELDGPGGNASDGEVEDYRVTIVGEEDCSLTVTNTNDSGDGSLREAITCANDTAGADTIDFNIPGPGPHSIGITSALPNITDPVIIDGSSEPDFAGSPVIEVFYSSFSGGTSGFVLAAGSGGSTINDLAINRFTRDGINIESDGNTIRDNLIGLSPAGDTDLGNDDDGIELDGASNNFILDNVVSGNDDDGIFVSSGSNGNSIRGNLVGTSADGTTGIGNSGIGIHLDSSSGNTIGGNNSGEGNVISFNGAEGVFITIPDSGGNSVLGNFIGTDATATLVLGNASHGVSFLGTGSNTVGSSPDIAGEGNVIAFNGGDGIRNQFGFGVSFFKSFMGNRIFDNDGLGINLVGGTEDSFGVTENDPLDTDTGANNLQNYPVLDSATTGGTTIVTGSLNSVPETEFTIEFFSNTTADPSGHGEGETILGTIDVTTDASGDAPINFDVGSALADGLFISATATNNSTSDTSEFAENVETEGEVQGCSLTVDTTDDVVDGSDSVNSLREAISCANMTAGAQTITLEPGTYVLTRSGSGEDANDTGDLDITDDLTIVSSTGVAADVIIDANELDRAIDVIGTQTSGSTVDAALDVSFELQGVTIQNGLVVGSGGGIQTNGPLTLDNVIVENSEAQLPGVSTPNARLGGGGVAALRRPAVSLPRPNISITNSTFRNNTTDSSGGGLLTTGNVTTFSNNMFLQNSAALAGGGAVFNAEIPLITESTFDGNTATSGEGGGFAVEGNDVIVMSTTVINNRALGSEGGGFANEGGSLELGNSTITDNQSLDEGGGFANEGGSLLIYDTLVARNMSTSAGGGGFVNAGGDMEMMRVTVMNNHSGDFGGGGFENQGGTLLMIDSTVTLNTSADVGGGIDNEGGDAEIFRSTISDNNAALNGGGLMQSGGILLLTDSTVSGNESEQSGGGLAVRGNEFTLINSTISSNTSAISGGGIFLSSIDGDNVLLTNSTIVQNAVNASVQPAGGGITHDDGNPPTLNNTIVASNIRNALAGTPTRDDLQNNYTGSNNLISDGTGSTGLANGSNGNQVGSSSSPLNPLLGSLQDNGGPTLTHALLSFSPAIDSGENTFAVDADGAMLQFDQRGEGFPRAVNSTVDMGAFESNLQGCSLTVDTTDDVVDGSDSVNSLREAISCANMTAGAQTITLDPGTYVLTRSGNSEGANDTGDLDITDDLTIVSSTGNAADVIITGRDESGESPMFLDDRIFHVHDVAASFIGITISYGNAPLGSAAFGSGGGIRNDQGSVTVRDSVISNNVAAIGGGISSFGAAIATLIVDNSTIRFNSATGNDTETPQGGGIYAVDDSVTIRNNSLIQGNVADRFGEEGGFNSFARGGGIAMIGGSLDIDFSTINQNEARALREGTGGDFPPTGFAEGGGLYISSSTTATIVDSRIDFNVAQVVNPNEIVGFGGRADGGGIYNTGELDISGSLVADNTAQGAAAVFGTEIGGNQADGGRGWGGGIYNANELIVHETEIVRNSATGGNSTTLSEGAPGVAGSAYGAGIYNGAQFPTLLTITNSRISSNIATGGGGTGIGGDAYGGGVFSNAMTTTIENSLIDANQAIAVEADSEFDAGEGEGGGIWLTAPQFSPGEAFLINSTVSGNQATTLGGGVYVGGGDAVTVQITNSTIAENEVFDDNTTALGGGIYHDDTAIITLNNTLVATNVRDAGNSDTPDDLFGNYTGNSNLVGVSDVTLTGLTDGTAGNQVGTVAMPIIPLISPLQNNGGLDPTHALLDGSPAINAGNNDLDNDSEGVQLDFDQRGDGFPRVVSSTVDIGAFETNAQACTLVVTNTADSGFGSLRDAIICANDTPGLDTISFAIAGDGPHTITPLSELPAVTDPVIIDGYSQGSTTGTTSDDASPNTLAVGNDADLRIVLDGSSAGFNSNGLNLAAGSSGSTITGLNIHSFAEDGIDIFSSGNTISGNFIGTNVSGTADLGNGDEGIQLENTGNNTIGGSQPADRNVISGNGGDAVSLQLPGSTNNRVENNYIGTNAAGTAMIGNDDDGVDIDSASNNFVIDNLVAGSGDDGVEIDGGDDLEAGDATGNVVQGNLIGTDITGTVDLGNGGAGVIIQGASQNTIGGTESSEGNLISGNAAGVVIVDRGAEDNTVAGNLIGIDASGSMSIPNDEGGVLILFDAEFNQVTDNFISGNSSHGVIIEFSSNNTVQRNFIGTNVAGNMELPNLGSGVYIASGFDNLIGGTGEDEGNLISGNQGDGVTILASFLSEGSGPASEGNVIQGNMIGTDLTGTGPICNVSAGVNILEGDDNLVGGTSEGAGNVIAANMGDGVFVGFNSENNPILGNSIFDNGTLGINLAPGGVSPNDPPENLDSDTGGNNLQNFPVLTGFFTDTTTTVTGELNSLPNENFRIEFFANDEVDDSGFGEGQTFLGFVNVETDSDGHADIMFETTSSVPANQVITSTATWFQFDIQVEEQFVSEGEQVPMIFLDTSEFSAPAPGVPVADLSLTKTVDTPSPLVDEMVTFTLSLNNAGPNDATNVEVTDMLPDGLMFESSMASQGIYDSGTGVWTVGTVTVGQTVTLDITATVLTTEQISNSAEVTASDQFDPDSSPNNQAEGEDDFATAGVGQCLFGLDGPLQVGRNRLVYTCPTPGSISAFVMGTEFGSFTFEEYDQEVDIADPEVEALGVANLDGVAVVHVFIPAAMSGEQIIFQAFEMEPNSQLSNVLVMNVANVPLLAEAGEGDITTTISRADVADVFTEAKARWQATGLSSAEQARLEAAEFRLLDLPEGVAGSALNTTIYLDRTAAGQGWFVDSTPADDSEFELALSTQERITTSGAAVDRLDLLTVVMHELGHVLGHDDESAGEDPAGLMHHELANGTRRLPTDLPEAELSRPLHNFHFAEDVNGDGLVTIADALDLVAHLRQHGSRHASEILRQLGSVGLANFDVSGDNIVSINDALAIVSRLRLALESEGEAEVNFAPTTSTKSSSPLKVGPVDQPLEQSTDESYESAVDAVLASYADEEE